MLYSEMNSVCYKALFNNAPIGLLLTSPNGTIIETNLFLCSITGYRTDELINKDIQNIIHKDDLKLIDSTPYQAENEAEKITHPQIRLIKKGEIDLHVCYHKSIHYSPRNEIEYFLYQFYKIPEALKKEKNQEDESLLINSLINNSSDIIYFKNRESQFIRFNKAFAEKFQVDSMESLIGKTDFDFFSEEHARQAFIDEQEIIRTGKSLNNIEEKETWPDGRVTWVSTSKIPLYNKKGEIIGTYGITRDLTERKMQELENKEKTSLLNAITAKMPVVIFKYENKKGIISLFGDNDIIKAFKSSKVAKIKVSENLSQLVPRIKSAKSNGCINFSSSSHTKNKAWFFENYIFEGQVGNEDLIGLALDVTEKKINEHKIKREAKNLENVNRELNQFAYIISHDLKAPLRAITNLSEWIVEDLAGNENEEVKEHLNLMRSRVLRMENLINGILTYSRVNRTELILEEIEVNKLLEEVIDSQLIPENFTIKKPENLPVIKYSKVNLEQIFSNLISNAIKHHDKPAGNIVIKCKSVEGFHEFTVSDDGPGIPKEYFEKIFMIFQTLQPRDTLESTGIGLTIVKKIVEERGGNIQVESEKGKGSSFIFAIPASDENNKNMVLPYESATFIS
ncbi:hypothetical protein BH23BAC1_BH23BAC1_18150 [soil metagenome]